jgi:thiamine-phosphate pyrophosphorylase
MVPLEAQRAARRKLRASARPVIGSHLPPALFLTDPQRTPDPVAVAERLPAGWGVIYRHFGAADRFQTAERLAHVCRKKGLVLLIAADPPLARAVKADGVHWPARLLSGMRTAGGFRLQTASAHSLREIMQARRAGVDAATLSAVFPSRSPSAGKPIGPLRFRLAARQGGLPLYALGGVSAANAARVTTSARARIAGWAAVESVSDVFGN